MAVKYAHVCTHAVDFYLQDRNFKERVEIIEISLADDFDKARKAKLMGYIRKAIRISHPLGAWRRASGATEIPHGDGFICVEKGEMIYMDLKQAFGTSDSSLQETPEIYGLGLHRCPGISLVDEVSVLYPVNRLVNLIKTQLLNIT
ncbi:hypothetical protein HYPSUDRAFT_452529 [Hypholoma sublateritium FD-334 SS-4]|uniref:Cytochrome P450 n=1 Tax=Hypholoma sublateritium (strain FD-334 SS-4) TaxID=945553 RepID=A0A0D2P8A3_HYPSF|nr:hypothetical protein HYPSUDRAFT_452529 [Hypholoma sublateritium FD-334 SS-4]